MNMLHRHLLGGDWVPSQRLGAVPFRRRDEGAAAERRPADVLGRRVLSVVRQLQAAVGAVDFAHLREQLEGLHAVRMIEPQLSRLVAALRDIYAAVAHLADGHAASRVLPEGVDEALRDETTFVPGEKAARRRLLQTVLEQHPADLERFIHVRIFGRHDGPSPLFFRISPAAARRDIIFPHSSSFFNGFFSRRSRLPPSRFSPFFSIPSLQRHGDWIIIHLLNRVCFP